MFENLSTEIIRFKRIRMNPMIQQNIPQKDRERISPIKLIISKYFRKALRKTNKLVLENIRNFFFITTRENRSKQPTKI
jgi:hypothetical protein